MRIAISLDKSVEENAALYFERAKKAKKKIEGAKKALKFSMEKLERLEKGIALKKQKQKPKIKRKKAWYEKFRWFFTSENMLFIAGRDATTNEIIIKKHTEKHDIVFHSELPSSPFGILKTNGKKPGQKSLEECAQFIACYSKAWKLGITVADIFYVMPEQVSKKAPSGEFIGKGSFMIYGKKNIIRAELKLFIGKTEDNMIMAGPESAIRARCKKYVKIVQGREKTSSIAKKIKKILDIDDLDEIIKAIPVGSSLK